MSIKKVKTSPLRVFVGTSANGEDAEACAVLESTLRASTKGSIDFRLMRLTKEPESPYYSDPRRGKGWKTTRWASPWTGLRWAVPALCDYQGRAVYFDCAQLVMGDVVELAAMPLPKGSIAAMHKDGASISTACVVWDCAAAEKWIPPLTELQSSETVHMEIGRELLRHVGLVAPLPAGWAVTDAEFSNDPGQPLRSIHFDNWHMQPHVALALPRFRKEGLAHWFSQGTRLPHYSETLAELVAYELESAIEAGFDISKYVPSEPYGAYAIRGVDGEDLRVRASLEE